MILNDFNTRIVPCIVRIYDPELRVQTYQLNKYPPTEITYNIGSQLFLVHFDYMDL
jgi:hypothetical protein